MSNADSTHKNKSNSISASENEDSSDAADTAAAANAPNSRIRWQSLQKNLLAAVDEWKTLEGIEGKSPEEEQLEKVKSLISDLKGQLDEF